MARWIGFLSVACAFLCFTGLAFAATIDGTRGNDNLYGTTGTDRFNSFAGDDRAWGLQGDDTIFGGDGFDQLYGNDGNDHIYGGGGNDGYRQITAADLRDCQPGGPAYITPPPCALHGGPGNDEVSGGDGSDYIDGGSGVDYLHGDAGSDVIFSWQDTEADTVVGGTSSGDFCWVGPTDKVSGCEHGARLCAGGSAVRFDQPCPASRLEAGTALARR